MRIQFIVWNIGSNATYKENQPSDVLVAVKTWLARNIKKDTEESEYRNVLILVECSKESAEKYLAPELGLNFIAKKDSSINIQTLSDLTDATDDWQIKALAPKTDLSEGYLVNQEAYIKKRLEDALIGIPKRPKTDLMIALLEWMSNTEGELDKFINYCKDKQYLLPNPNVMDRIRFFAIFTPNNETFLMVGAVHGWSKIDDNNHLQNNKKLIEYILKEEHAYYPNNWSKKNSRLILAGDFNINPYEGLIYNNIPSSADAEQFLTLYDAGFVKQQDKPHFYNPTWILYGNKPGYSFKYTPTMGSEKMLNLFDGVIMREKVIDLFSEETLKIDGEIHVSDHFPLIFEMEST